MGLCADHLSTGDSRNTLLIALARIGISRLLRDLLLKVDVSLMHEW